MARRNPPPRSRRSPMRDLPAPGASAGLDPLLAEAVLLLRASEFTGSDGDNWPNEGTGGSAYDGVAVGTPEFVDPPGFILGGDEGVGPYYTVPTGAAIQPGEGSFTFFARFDWTHATQVFDPVAAKLTGTIGVDGSGWFLGSGSAVSGNVAIVAKSDGVYAAAISPGVLSEDEHSMVIRVDRDGDVISVFTDGGSKATADASTVPSVTSTNPIIVGRGTGNDQTGRAYAYWDRALSDAEIESLDSLFP